MTHRQLMQALLNGEKITDTSNYEGNWIELDAFDFLVKESGFAAFSIQLLEDYEVVPKEPTPLQLRVKIRKLKKRIAKLELELNRSIEE